MGFIRTVLGDVDPADLGVTYSHEHLICRPPYWIERGEWDLVLDDPERTLADVLEFREAGGRSIVEATCLDYGRDVVALAEIARRAGVHVIATTGLNKGFLWSARRPGHDETFAAWIERCTLDELVRWMVREVEEGIEGTPYRAGQVKFGTGYNSISPLEEKVLRAAARAHLETGAPLHSHTEAGTMALEQAELLRREGVDLSRVSFGHMDRNPDPYLHRQLARTGAFLSFDGLGKVKYHPDSVRTQCILELVRRGHAEQILISGDTARRSYYRAYGHGTGLAWILRRWVPRFLEEAEEAGFDGERLVHLFLVENPRRYLTFARGRRGM